jgi:hypothetical protein
MVFVMGKKDFVRSSKKLQLGIVQTIKISCEVDKNLEGNEKLVQRSRYGGQVGFFNL